MSERYTKYPFDVLYRRILNIVKKLKKEDVQPTIDIVYHGLKTEYHKEYVGKGPKTLHPKIKNILEYIKQHPDEKNTITKISINDIGDTSRQRFLNNIKFVIDANYTSIEDIYNRIDLPSPIDTFETPVVKRLIKQAKALLDKTPKKSPKKVSSLANNASPDKPRIKPLTSKKIVRSKLLGSDRTNIIASAVEKNTQRIKESMEQSSLRWSKLFTWNVKKAINRLNNIGVAEPSVKQITDEIVKENELNLGSKSQESIIFHVKTSLEYLKTHPDFSYSDAIAKPSHPATINDAPSVTWVTSKIKGDHNNDGFEDPNGVNGVHPVYKSALNNFRAWVKQAQLVLGATGVLADSTSIKSYLKHHNAYAASGKLLMLNEEYIFSNRIDEAIQYLKDHPMFIYAYKLIPINKTDIVQLGTIDTSLTNIPTLESLGFSTSIPKLDDFVNKTIKYGEYYSSIGSHSPKVLLITMPKGSNQKLMIRSLSDKFSLRLYAIDALQFAATSITSISALSNTYTEAIDHQPSLIHIHNLDKVFDLLSDINTNKDKKKLILSLQHFLQRGINDDYQILVVATINSKLPEQLNSIDYFPVSMVIPLPSISERQDMFIGLTKNHLLGEDIFERQHLDEIASKTPGYSRNDMKHMLDIASSISIERRIANDETVRDILSIGSPLPPLSSPSSSPSFSSSSSSSSSSYSSSSSSPATSSSYIVSPSLHTPKVILADATDISNDIFKITMMDIRKAITQIKPNAVVEGISTIPTVTWEEIGGLFEARKEIFNSILFPLKYPDIYSKFGISQSAGILMYGPRGTGKTSIAKALANETSVNFIQVNPTDIFRKYVGEAEKNVSNIFAKARTLKPCIIFFDEFDSIGNTRDSGGDSASQVGKRVVTQLLVEMDGFESRNGIFLLAATNRPEAIDPSFLRPGRFDKSLYIGLPTKEERQSILKVHLRSLEKNGISIDKINLNTISSKTEGFSGADIALLVKEAATIAAAQLISEIERDNSGGVKLTYTPHISLKDFNQALNNIKPSGHIQNTYPTAATSSPTKDYYL